MFDLSMLQNRTQLADTMLADIEHFSVQHHKEEPRKHLGISQIGDKCNRKLWYDFRWAKREGLSGKMYRLFDRGHREEDRFYHYLKGIGCKFDTKPGDKQTRVTGCEGHFGGAVDNTGYLPEQYGWKDKVLFEFKTMSQKYFGELQKQRLRRGQPEYWAQHCTYGYKLGIDYGVFICVNKNTDEWYIEVNQLDHDFGKFHEDKALQIITSPTSAPPMRISNSSANFACKWCHYSGICYHEEAVEINCRSCKYSVAMPEGKWGCNLYQLEIPESTIPVGCPKHIGIHKYQA